ncbi:uncharacterized protein CIMG_02403 [Coccidioides immitis RS]|uniref:Uncharacterized protein n=1 Tax=Coccidioides immitis (strain RS) TaxID=246410 RepID=J3KLA9_COCIM|nr:uncharacterized protein CIMG_02403 [Coccidioides immitis RS]EAS37049.3 hypothetical protein CIMG_02403 [Coccidioides immitis RS]
MLLKGEVNMPASFARRATAFKYRIVVNFYILLNRVKHRMRQHKRARKEIPEVSTDVVNETGLESTLARSDSELAPNTHPSSSLRRLILLARFASWQQSCQSCIQQRGATMPVDSEKLRVSTAEFDGGETSKLCFSYGTR